MKIKSFFSKKSIGIDISDAEIRIVVLLKTKKQVAIKMIVTHTIAPGICIDGKVKDWLSLTNHLQDLVALHGLIGLPTTLSLPSNLVRMQKLARTPKVTMAAILAEISLEVKRDLPAMQENICIDYCATETEVEYAVTREEYIEHIKACMEAVGLQLKVIDIDVLVVRLLLKEYGIIALNKLSAALWLDGWTARFLVFSESKIINQTWSLLEEDILLQIKAKFEIFQLQHPTLFIPELLCFQVNAITWQDLKPNSLFHSVKTVEVFNPFKMNGELINVQQSTLLLALANAWRGLKHG